MLVHVQAEFPELGDEDPPVIHVVEPGMRPMAVLAATDRASQTVQDVGLHVWFVIVVETNGPHPGDAVSKPCAEEIGS